MPESVVHPDNLQFKASWLMEQADDYSGFPPDIRKILDKIHVGSNKGFEMPLELLDREYKSLYERYLNEDLDDSQAALILGRMTGRMQKLAEESTGQYLVQQPPKEFGSVFASGDYRAHTKEWAKRGLIDVLDVTDIRQRNIWLMSNLRVFNNPNVIQNPEVAWKGYMGLLRSELASAVRYAGIGENSEIEKTERKVIAALAITGAARAMEASAGDYGDYLSFICGADKEGKLKLSVQDSESDILLHGDPGKIREVLEDPLVAHYYGKLIVDSGIEDLHLAGEDDQASSFTTNVDKAKRGKLIEYLKKSAKLGGMDGYVTKVLLAEDSDYEKRMASELYGENGDLARHAAAKLAADIFEVDNLTRWTYAIDPGGDLRLAPVRNWGGDPFAYLVDPTLLPRKIKKMFRSEVGRKVLDLLDGAFHPDDIFGGQKVGNTILDRFYNKYLVPASAVCNLKNMNRICKAMFAVVGGSRGSTIPSLDQNGLGSIMAALEELDQVYTGVERRREDEKLPENLRGHVMGLLLARIVLAKLLAATLETPRPGLAEKISGFDVSSKLPLQDVLIALWGPKPYDMKAGMLANLQGGRTSYVIKGNIFGAEKLIDEAKQLAISNDQKRIG